MLLQFNIQSGRYKIINKLQVNLNSQIVLMFSNLQINLSENFYKRALII